MTDPQQIRDFFSRYSIRREATLFYTTGNPIHAWRLYRWLRNAGQSIPEWFLEYLDRCAERIDQEKPATPKQIAEAFGLAPNGGGPSWLSRADKSSDRLAAVQHVWFLQKALPGVALEELWAEVAEHRNVSYEYVRDAYYEFSKKLE